MKLSMFFLIPILVLASCGPATIIPPLTPTETIQPVAQSNLHNDWIVFSPVPVIQSPIIIGKVVYDSQGYLWAISSEGILRWNTSTYEFTSFPFPSKSTADTTSDLILFNGMMWLALLDGRVGHFSNGEWNYQQVSSKPLFDFSDTGDRLWLSGVEGLFYLDGMSWKVFKLPTQTEIGLMIEDVAKAKNGTLWFRGTVAFKTDEVYSLTGDKWQGYPGLNPPTDF